MNHTVTGARTGAVVAAAIGCLQPGIDPIFLTVLSDAGGVAPDAHGWIVGATQAGMAAGALLVWLGATRLPARTGFAAAWLATMAALATAFVDELAPLLLVRATFGVAMGIVYTDAMSRAAALHPTGAYAAVFLTQLVMSTAAAAALPAVAQAAGAQTALLALAAAPAILVILTGRMGARDPGEVPARVNRPAPAATSPVAWALAFATFAFICATMAIWSSTAALAIGSGLGTDVIGLAVAVGSVAGAVTALVIMRDRRWMPLSLTGLLCGGCLASPLLLTPLGDRGLFIAAIVLLNIGSTTIIVRCSGAATAASDDPLFRRFVACTHPLGMIAGPVMAAALTSFAGAAGLSVGALMSLTLGCAALFAGRTKISSTPLDENRTPVQTSLRLTWGADDR